MFISDEEADNRLSSLDNLVNKLQRTRKNNHCREEFSDLINRKIHNGGRPKGRLNDDDEERSAIAQTALIEGPNIAAEIHSTTPSRASLLSKGIVTHGLGRDKSLIEKVSNRKEMLHEKALDILMSALDGIDGNLPVKPRDLSAIASDMSKVAEKMRPTAQVDNSPKVQVVIYTPRVKDASEFDEIVY